MRKLNVFDLKSQMVFYGSYHTAKMNFLIHVFGVPLLIWSTQVWLAHLPPPLSSGPLSTLEFSLGPYLIFKPNWAQVMATFYSLYFFTLQPVAASLYAIQSLLIAMHATYFTNTPNGLEISGIIWISAWIAQFIGHGVFEGRAPALLDNLFGAIVLAPFFVLLEELMVLGFFPNLHREIRNGIGMEVKRVRSEQKAKTK